MSFQNGVSSPTLFFWHRTSYGRDQEVITGNEYRSGDFYGDRYANINYDKDIRLPPSPYDAGVYSGGRKHDWDRNNNVIVNSIPGPRKQLSPTKAKLALTSFDL